MASSTEETTAGQLLEPLVTIVMPTYRRPEFLQQALASVLNQTYTRFEAHVYDNAADKQTRAVCESFDDPRVIYHPRPTNLGMVANALDGLASATTRYVTEVDDDDLLEPGAIDALVGALERDPEAAFAFGRYELMDGDTLPLTQLNRQVREQAQWETMAQGRVPDDQMVAYVLGSPVRMYAALFRSDSVDWRSLDVATTAYDTHLLLTLATGGATATYVDVEVVRLRQHPAAETFTARVTQLEAHRFSVVAALGRAKPNDIPLLESALTQVDLALCWALDRSGDRRRARVIAREVAGVRGQFRSLPLRLWLALPPWFAGGARALKAKIGR